MDIIEYIFYWSVAQNISYLFSRLCLDGAFTLLVLTNCLFLFVFASSLRSVLDTKK
jgi:hypothetical protein